MSCSAESRSSAADRIAGPSTQAESAALAVPFDAAQAKAAQETLAKQLKKSGPVEKNSLGMELVLIPPGKFTMGSPDTEKDRQDNEKQVEVTLTKAWYLGKTEVTQGQWKAVMGTTPWHDRDSVREGDRYAATYVSWDEAREFCRKLSETERASYHLPSEAQWEFACRAGTAARFSFGDDDGELSNFAWWGGISGDGSAKEKLYAHEVGLKKANPFGLLDMHGNVWEWCEDTYSPELPGGENPLHSADVGVVCVGRGGGWNSNASRCRSAFRNRIPNQTGALKGARYSYLGFRVARTVDDEPGQRP